MCDDEYARDNITCTHIYIYIYLAVYYNNGVDYYYNFTMTIDGLHCATSTRRPDRKELIIIFIRVTVDVL